MRNIDNGETKEKERLVKIAIHLHCCQLTALMTTNWYADTCAKKQNTKKIILDHSPLPFPFWTPPHTHDAGWMVTKFGHCHVVRQKLNILCTKCLAAKQQLYILESWLTGWLTYRPLALFSVTGSFPSILPSSGQATAPAFAGQSWALFPIQTTHPLMKVYFSLAECCSSVISLLGTISVLCWAFALFSAFLTHPATYPATWPGKSCLA